MRAGRSARAGAALAAIGGAATAVGSILDWAQISGRRAAVAANGTDLFGGITLGAGLVALTAGLLLLSAGGRRWRAVFAALVLVGGLSTAGLAVYVLSSHRVVIERLAKDARQAGRAARRATVSAKPGLFVVLAGGIVAAAGGVAGLISAGGGPGPVVDSDTPDGENTPTDPATEGG